jgi:RNA polymerase sigma-70 factor (ECF subfamily)
MLPLDPDDVIRDYGPLLSRIARQFYRTAESARDALQEAWVEVLRSLPQYRGESSPQTWIYRVAWRRMLAYRTEERRETLRQIRERYDTEQLPASPQHEGEARLWIESVCRNCMTGVLHCLSSDQRLTFLFRQIAGLGVRDTAAILETTESNVRQLFHRARRILAQFLTEDCAYSGPSAHCRYGADPVIHSTGLHAEFARLGAFSSRVAAYRAAKGIFPAKNEWERYLRTGQLSQPPSPLP